MNDFSLSSIPGRLQWRNRPLDWNAGDGARLTITASELTDLSIGERRDGQVLQPRQAGLSEGGVCVAIAHREELHLGFLGYHLQARCAEGPQKRGVSGA
jgi:hypothetical protein